ncbi:MAG: hypothetical protein J3K34DRAFT_503345 [Monoraphidium minutum]|nr:MAG: hypothetical protein J3K34DRAFT_503345 [Monoraphidium minutum]
MASSGTAGGQQGAREWRAPVVGQVEQLVEMLERGCQGAGCQMEAVAAAAAPLAGRLLARWQADHGDGGGNGGGGRLEVPAADALAGWLHTLLLSQVTLESSASLLRMHRAYCRMRGALGLGDAALAACLGPAGRAMLAALLLGARRGGAGEGDAKLAVTVRRGRAFWDALGDACRQGLVPDGGGGGSGGGGGGGGCAGGGVPCKLFPRFTDGAAGASRPSSGGGGGDDRSAAGAAPAGVEAGEGHGPRKEFFEAAGADMAQPEERAEAAALGGGGGELGEGCGGGGLGALFVQIKSTGAFWPDARLRDGAAARRAFWLAGWLAGQALPNRAALGLRLSPVLFEKLLAGPDFQQTLATLRRHDPAAVAALERVLALPAAELAELGCLEGFSDAPAAAPRRSNSGRGGGGRVGACARRYVEAAARRLLLDDVAWQFGAMERGFWSAASREARGWGWAAALEVAVCGGPPQPLTAAALRRAFRIVVEGGGGGEAGGEAGGSASEQADEGSEGGGGGGGGALAEATEGEAAVAACLWEVLDGWPPQLLAAFLRFVTGSERLPPPGTEALRVSFPFAALGAAERRAALRALPQAHTCTNTLELPDYYSALRAAEGAAEGGVAQREGSMHGREGGAAAGEGEDGGSGGGGGAARRRARCREVLAERLEYAVVHGSGAYALDELVER